MTVFVSIVASLAFESPVLIIEKLIFGPTNTPDTIRANEQCAIQPNQSEIQYEQMENVTN